jgi:hypothetical protein
MGNGDDVLPNQAFELKLLFMALAGLNVLVFYATGLNRQVESIEAGQDAPLAAKLVGGASLFYGLGSCTGAACCHSSAAHSSAQP